MLRMIEDLEPRLLFDRICAPVVQAASDLYSSLKKGLEYVKGHPARALTLSMMASATIRSHTSYAIFAPQASASMIGASLLYFSNGVEALPVTGQFPAVIQLSSLNGINGVELDGETNDNCGFSVSQAGDINQDGIQDVIVGAYGPSNIGRAYVVFGKKIWTSPFSLSTLSGENGFRLDGANAGDFLSYQIWAAPWIHNQAVSHAGDVNNDGIDDIVIGSFGANKVYVLYGKNNWTSPISLSTLNGTNGFQLNGVEGVGLGFAVSGAGDLNRDGIDDIIIGGAIGGTEVALYQLFGRNDWTSPMSISASNGNMISGGGFTVSTAGDVNHDGIDDIIFGTYVYGKSYVIFGNANYTGATLLSSLNGVNGFQINGVVSGDGAGHAVSRGGDINHDGIDDIIVGTNEAPFSAGKTYVIFGKSNWTSPISLGSINGTNGFRLDGITGGDWSGSAVSQAGDFNNDGIADFMTGASYTSANVGSTYLIFGTQNWSSPIALSTLNGKNGLVLMGLPFDYSGWSVAQAGDVNNDGVQDIIIGAPGKLSAAGKAYVVFGDSPPVLVSNQLTVVRNDVITLGSSNIAAYDLNHANDTLIFVVTNVTAGAFQLTNNPGVSIRNFTQAQIASRSIVFIHDGSINKPSYDVGVTTAGFAFVSPVPARIDFFLTAMPTAAPTFIPTASPSFMPSVPITPESSLSSSSSITLTPTTQIDNGGNTQSNQNTLGVGVGVGVPLLLSVAAAGLFCYKKREKNDRVANKNTEQHEKPTHRKKRRSQSSKSMLTEANDRGNQPPKDDLAQSQAQANLNENNIYVPLTLLRESSGLPPEQRDKLLSRNYGVLPAQPPKPENLYHVFNEDKQIEKGEPKIRPATN